MAEKTVLVTGATGFVGSYVVREFLERGFDVVGFDLAPDPRLLDQIATPEQRARVTLLEGDITDAERVREVVGAEPFAAIAHLASTLSRTANRRPRLAIDVVCGGTLNVFEAALEHSIPHVAWASSAAVFGAAPDGDPVLSASALAAPQDIYGSAKSLSEMVGATLNRYQGLRSVGLRFTVVYGYGRAMALGRGSAGGPVVDLIEGPARGEGPVAVRFGDEPMDWLHVTDAARAVVLGALAPDAARPAYTVVGHRATFRDAAREVLEAIPDAQIELEPGTSPRPLAMNFDGTAAASELGYRPLMDLRSGIRQYIADVRTFTSHHHNEEEQ